MDVSSHGDVLVDELEVDIGKLVRIHDFPDPYDSDGEEPFGERDPAFVKKCLNKSATFPSTAKTSGEEDANPELSLRLLYSEESIVQAMSMPLVSAMKGSREKQGLNSRKFRVIWAPEVYDPIPDSLCYTVKCKEKKSRKDRDKDKDNNSNRKKNGKKGQKGNSSRGGGGSGKDKKQYAKLGGMTD